MPHYRVKINGTNFLLDFEGTPTRLGFYTDRFVVAADPEAAGLAALELLREGGKLQHTLNESEDPPKLQVKEITKIEAGSAPEVQPGLAFYGEGD